MIKETISLFKTVLIPGDGKEGGAAGGDVDVEALVAKTMEHGFILAPAVIAAHDKAGIDTIVTAAKGVFGLSGSQMNQAFHKSWQKIRDAPACQLVMEQLVHYLTTYGFKTLGIHDKDSVYIPAEPLNVPGLEADIPLVVITGISRDELMRRVMVLLSSGIAMKEDTLVDVATIAMQLGFEEEQLAMVRNKEARVMLHEYLGLVPLDPVEFLRFAVYLVTGTTLLVKNKTLIDTIKGNRKTMLAGSFKRYDEKAGFKVLARVFNRFKPLFLAFKATPVLRHDINVISKLSKKYHRPMPEDYLNQVTARLRRGIAIDLDELRAHLDKVNVFRKARLSHALQFRLEDPASIMYRIRNGKAYATAFVPARPDLVPPVLDVVRRSIVDDLARIVHGKSIYIPKNVVYALPSSEKQFTGNFPSGTFVQVNQDMVFGIHWKDVGDESIDLDLALTSLDGKFGWDALYRSNDDDILFSGDVTEASGDGASELFHVKHVVDGRYIVSVNHYNRRRADPDVPFSIFVGSDPVEDLLMNYMVDPNRVVATARTSMSEKQKILGLLVMNEGTARFHFCEAILGAARSISMNPVTTHALGYLAAFHSNPISLNDILRDAGAIIVQDLATRAGCDVDLSPETIDKATIVNLLTP